MIASSDVKMRLLVGGTSLPIAQMGADFLLLDQSIDHPPADAQILLSIDGRERRWGVRLPGGVAAGQERVLLSNVSIA